MSYELRIANCVMVGCVAMFCLSASATTVTTMLQGPPETTCTETPRPVLWPDAEGYSPTQTIPLPVRSAKRGQANIEFVRVEVPWTSEAVVVEIVPVDKERTR